MSKAILTFAAAAAFATASEAQQADPDVLCRHNPYLRGPYIVAPAKRDLVIAHSLQGLAHAVKPGGMVQNMMHEYSHALATTATGNRVHCISWWNPAIATTYKGSKPGWNETAITAWYGVMGTADPSTYFTGIRTYTIGSANENGRRVPVAGVKRAIISTSPFLVDLALTYAFRERLAKAYSSEETFGGYSIDRTLVQYHSSAVATSFRSGLLALAAGEIGGDYGQMAAMFFPNKFTEIPASTLTPDQKHEKLMIAIKQRVVSTAVAGAITFGLTEIVRREVKERKHEGLPVNVGTPFTVFSIPFK